MEKLDIKALARELKAGSPAPPASESPTVKMKEKALSHKVTNKKWTSLLDEIRNRKDLNSEGCVYIDSDLYDVLRLLKLNTGVTISFLISTLVEQFILEHKDDIRKSLKPKSNRYLEK